MKSLVNKSPIGNAFQNDNVKKLAEKFFLGIRYITSNQGLAIAL